MDARSGRRWAAMAALAVLGAVASGHAQEPRFRGGTNLVRLDVYVSLNGQAVTDLTQDDFEVREDSTPQTVSSFEFIRAGAPAPDSARTEPNTVAESRARASQPESRLFVLFLDTFHTHVEGSYRAQNPMAALLERVVGERDLVGVMTPEISARNIAFSPRTVPVERLLRDNWAWGARQGLINTDPRDQRLQECYPDAGPTAGVAQALIARRREGQLLKSLEDLVQHLEGTREERSFVLLLTEGWMMSRPDGPLAAPIRLRDGSDLRPGGPEPLGVTPDGKLATGDRVGPTVESCERQRALLASEDLEMGYQLLMRQANRANVSFYPIDPRGLVAFDTDMGPGRLVGPVADAQGMAMRQSNLRRLATETDGAVVLNTNLDVAGPRLLTDVGSYYLLGYVSTNTKLDGRYRRLSVRVKRPGVDVRARPGYLAPSQADLAAAQTTAAASLPTPTARVSEALSRLPVSRRPAPLLLQASGGPGAVDVTIELDRVAAAAPEWAKGGSAKVSLDPADRGGPSRVVEELVIEPGARIHTMRLPGAATIAPGRYTVRVEVLPSGTRSPVIVSTLVDVPATTALLGSALRATRRGPGTGRGFQPTADARFRRTERLVAEVPRVDAEAVVAGRLLNSTGQLMQIPVAVGERVDDATGTRTVTAELSLAPLAAGEYVLELTATKGDRTETLTYAIRLVP